MAEARAAKTTRASRQPAVPCASGRDICTLEDAETVVETLRYECVTINHSELECGPMPNVMVALPNIGGALCSTPQSLADAHY